MRGGGERRAYMWEWLQLTALRIGKESWGEFENRSAIDSSLCSLQNCTNIGVISKYISIILGFQN